MGWIADAPRRADVIIAIHIGDCREVMATFDAASFDSVVCDPPYGLEFMGKKWDRIGDAGQMSHAGPRDRNPSTGIMQDWHHRWATEAYRVLKPGGHLLAFGGTRTFHRLACAIEDAGFEIRDSIAWLYGSGFPKSLDVSKAIDKGEGIWRGRSTGVVKGEPATPDAKKWQGWGTALKPAFEPIVVARKPLIGTVAANVLAHGTGALNVDGCRVGTDDPLTGSGVPPLQYGGANSRPFHNEHQAIPTVRHDGGRWPANVVLDESQAAVLDSQSGERFNDTGGASRFFYCAKASSSERPREDGVAHPTVKPVELMRWLVRLVTPEGGHVLDPFAGSGTTGEACIVEGFDCTLIEQDAGYMRLIEARLGKDIQPVLT